MLNPGIGITTGTHKTIMYSVLMLFDIRKNVQLYLPILFLTIQIFN